MVLVRGFTGETVKGFSSELEIAKMGEVSLVGIEESLYGGAWRGVAWRGAVRGK